MQSRCFFFVLAAAAAVVSCGEPATEQVPGNDARVSDSSPGSTNLPAAEPSLDRAALLIATARAASAAALGQDDGAAQRKLRGALFTVRIRFGCPAANMGVPGGPFGVKFDEQSRTLRVRAQPDLGNSEHWVRQIGGDAVEAVEGFKMRRPWLLDAGCTPAARPSSADQQQEPAELNEVVPAPSEQWVGIAQFFTETDSRTRRRDDRAYEATKILREGMGPSTMGYDLVLTGRLKELPSGQVILCQPSDTSRPANCVISVIFDAVRIERGDDRSVLAEWGAG